MRDRRQARPTRARAPRWAWRARGYALYQGLQQLSRRKLASFATLTVLGITLALPVAAGFGAASLADITKRSVAEESLTVYLDPALPDLDGAELAGLIRRQAGVREVRYVSHDEALAQFEASTPIDAVLETLGHNPLPGVVIVHPDAALAFDPARLQHLSSQLKRLDGVQHVQMDLEWARRIQAMFGLLRIAAWILATFLTLTALLVIGNTVRLELFRRQREFEVAELLGASRSFLNRPILYTGVLYGLLGGVMAASLGRLVLGLLKADSDTLAGLYASSFRLELPGPSELAAVVLASGLLGLVGALTALRRPLKQNLSNR